ncbi:MAG: hypothetical protein QXO51_01405 [Halobacteria archaeon]
MAPGAMPIPDGYRALAPAFCARDAAKAVKARAKEFAKKMGMG